MTEIKGRCPACKKGHGTLHRWCVYVYVVCTRCGYHGTRVDDRAPNAAELAIRYWNAVIDISEESK